jgi:RES domain-containing protein
MHDPTVPPTRVDGTFHRYCSPAHKPTDVPAIAARDARWHRRHGPAHLYATDSVDTMWAEHHKHLPANVDAAQVVVRVAALDVEGLRVLDVANAVGRRTVGVSLGQLVGDDYGPCQELADRAAAHGYEGILAPSAARPSGLVLVVFAAFRHRLTVADDLVTFG